MSNNIQSNYVPLPFEISQKMYAGVFTLQDAWYAGWVWEKGTQDGQLKEGFWLCRVVRHFLRNYLWSQDSREKELKRIAMCAFDGYATFLETSFKGKDKDTSGFNKHLETISATNITNVLLDQFYTKRPTGNASDIARQMYTYFKEWRALERVKTSKDNELLARMDRIVLAWQVNLIIANDQRKYRDTWNFPSSRREGGVKAIEIMNGTHEVDVPKWLASDPTIEINIDEFVPSKEPTPLQSTRTRKQSSPTRGSSPPKSSSLAEEIAAGEKYEGEFITGSAFEAITKSTPNTPTNSRALTQQNTVITNPVNTLPTPENVDTNRELFIKQQPLTLQQVIERVYVISNMIITDRKTLEDKKLIGDQFLNCTRRIDLEAINRLFVGLWIRNPDLYDFYDCDAVVRKPLNVKRVTFLTKTSELIVTCWITFESVIDTIPNRSTMFDIKYKANAAAGFVEHVM